MFTYVVTPELSIWLISSVFNLVKICGFDLVIYCVQGTGLIGSNQDGSVEPSQESIALTFEECQQIRSDYYSCLIGPVSLKKQQELHLCSCHMQTSVSTLLATASACEWVSCLGLLSTIHRNGSAYCCQGCHCMQ